MGVGISLQGEIRNRIILCECRVDREPIVYARPWFWNLSAPFFFLLESLPLSLGIAHSFFLFTNPPLLLFHPCSFLLIPLILLSLQFPLPPPLPDLSTSPSLCPLH